MPGCRLSLRRHELFARPVCGLYKIIPRHGIVADHNEAIWPHYYHAKLIGATM